MIPTTMQGIISGLTALVFAFLSIRSFKERGFLLNNAYIFASEKKRKEMQKKPYYRQSAIIFCLLSVLFTVVSLAIFLKDTRIQLLAIPVAAATVIYAIVSSVRL